MATECYNIYDKIDSMDNHIQQNKFVKMSTEWVLKNATPIEKVILYIYTLRSAPINIYLLNKKNVNMVDWDNIYTFIGNFYMCMYNYKIDNFTPFVTCPYIYINKDLLKDDDVKDMHSLLTNEIYSQDDLINSGLKLTDANVKTLFVKIVDYSIKIIDNLIERSPKTEDNIIFLKYLYPYPGMPSGPIKFTGKEIDLKQHMFNSATYIRKNEIGADDVASDFSNDNCCVLLLKVKKGQNIIVIPSELHEFPEQKEMIFPTETIFGVICAFPEEAIDGLDKMHYVCNVRQYWNT